jgi:CHRD domain
MRLRPFAVRVSVLVVVVSALAVPAALAGGAAMHPELGARLAGMGEHGVVNLQAQPTKGKLCWTFDLPTTKGITGASIHKGTTAVVLVRLGSSYVRKACTTASAMTLEHLESSPGKYLVFVDTKGHPGELRGKLFAGMAHM